MVHGRIHSFQAQFDAEANAEVSSFVPVDFRSPSSLDKSNIPTTSLVGKKMMISLKIVQI